MTPRQLRRHLRQLVKDCKRKSCADCGIQKKPSQMSYDHLRDKSFNLGGSLRGRTETEVRAEISKCEVVCLECHRTREDKRKGLQPELEPCEVAEES